MTTQTENVLLKNQQDKYYRYSNNKNVDDVLKKDVPICRPLSKEWEWWECCNHTIE